MTRDVHWCVTVDYQQIANDNIANQIHGFTIDYDKFILIFIIKFRSRKQYGFYEIVDQSRPAQPWNFTLFSQQLSFYLQQQFIFAATLKAITESIFIMQRVLFLKENI